MRTLLGYLLIIYLCKPIDRNIGGYTGKRWIDEVSVENFWKVPERLGILWKRVGNNEKRKDRLREGSIGKTDK